MIRAIALALAFLLGCSSTDAPHAGDVTSFRRIEGREFAWGDPKWRVYHDDDRGVTCWAIGGTYDLSISCLPDSAFAGGGYR